MPTWKKKVPGGSDVRAGMPNPRLHTLDPLRATALFMVWKVGSRAPRSFHITESDARQTALEIAMPGERVCILRAAIIGTVSVSESIVTFEAAAAEPRLVSA